MREQQSEINKREEELTLDSDRTPLMFEVKRQKQKLYRGERFGSEEEERHEESERRRRTTALHVGLLRGAT